MEKTIYCSCCEESIPEDNTYYFNDEIYCEDCYYDETFVCRCCNERFINDENSGDSETPLCNSCFDE